MNAPSGIRTRATTLKGWRPRPLVDGGGRARIAREACLHWPGGPVAQSVEQGTFNPKVAGSIPARPTKPEKIRERSQSAREGAKASNGQRIPRSPRAQAADETTQTRS